MKVFRVFLVNSSAAIDADEKMKLDSILHLLHARIYAHTL